MATTEDVAVELAIQELAILLDVTIPLRDNFKLVADSGLRCMFNNVGANWFRWSILLQRTPYMEHALYRFERTHCHLEPCNQKFIARWFVGNVCVVMMQGCRGHYAPLGVLANCPDETEGEFDTIDRITGHNRCKGGVGKFGVSYGANTQLAMCGLSLPGLVSYFVYLGGCAYAHHIGIQREEVFGTVGQPFW